jgi:polyhydroxybutyrate depolymerase
MRHKLLPLLALAALSTTVQAQLDSIFDQGMYRTYIVHLPTGYSSARQYPLLIDMHGLGSTATAQQLYSRFDAQADAYGFIAVYPNGSDGSWHLIPLNGIDDVAFLAHLVDTLRGRFSTSDCLFFTGMSNGGFMSYRMACLGPHAVTAIGVVAGNMGTATQVVCQASPGLPVIHFHGTADGTVDYNGGFGVPSVPNTVAYWAELDQCGPVEETAMPDINTGDNCTATRLRYPNGVNGSEVVLYRIDNGGHTWPGAIHIPTLGNTNQDIDATALIAAFFAQYCTMPTGVATLHAVPRITLAPNPVDDQLRITVEGALVRGQVLDAAGRVQRTLRLTNGTNSLPVHDLAPGLYLVRSEAGEVLRFVKR